MEERIIVQKISSWAASKIINFRFEVKIDFLPRHHVSIQLQFEKYSPIILCYSYSYLVSFHLKGAAAWINYT